MPTSAEPYQMPEGTAIDLRASGVGIDDYFYVPGVHDNSEGIIIMFAPEGRVSRVMFSVLPVDDPDPHDDAVRRSRSPTTCSCSSAAAKTPRRRPWTTIRRSSRALSGKTEQQLQETERSGQLAPRREPLDRDRLAVGPRRDHGKRLRQSAGDHHEHSPTIGRPKNMRNEQIKASREFAREMVQVGRTGSANIKP